MHLTDYSTEEEVLSHIRPTSPCYSNTSCTQKLESYSNIIYDHLQWSDCHHINRKTAKLFSTYWSQR